MNALKTMPHGLIQSALQSLTNSQEAKHYLTRFHNNELRFAVVKVGGGTLANELAELTQSLALLAHLGLTPIIIHGAGIQLDQAIDQAGITTIKKDGLRVTDAATMQVVRPVMYEVNQQLVAALEAQGVRATGVVHGVFECDYLDQDQYGLVGEVKNIHLSPIKQALQMGHVPVLSCLGETASGQVVNINADIATRELVWQINPHKIIFVTPTGGLLDQDQQIISAIHLHNSYDQLMQADWLHSGMKLKLEQIKQMLEPMDSGHSVSITSSQNLTRELFTHQGAGTYINMGEQIHAHDALNPALEAELMALFEHSFGQQFQAGFLQSLPIKAIYLAESGRAAALVTEGFRGHAYLHKFAVTPAAQGEGLASALWRTIKQNHPQMYWRSRQSNAINGWYFKQAECAIKAPAAAGAWVGFACGLFPAEAMTCMHHAFTEDSGWQSTVVDELEIREQKHA